MDKKPGPTSRALFRDEQTVVAPGQQRIALLSELALASGRGATVTDLDSNSTSISSLVSRSRASVCPHPAYIEKVEAQLRRISVGASPPRTGRSC
jgi:hypothetical protein